MLNGMVFPPELFSGKNLFGFSAGVDSTALFFQLIEAKIDFDIAIVNYNLRPEAIEEEYYARELARKYGLKIYILEPDVDLSSNTEAIARDVRYKFFNRIISKDGYDNLILGHQLNDKMEWLLMKIANGAGLNTLSGFDVINNDRSYTIIRPMIFVPRHEIQAYLDDNNIKHFVDSSNLTMQYTRNQYRNNFVNNFVKEHSKGIAKSFNIMLNEKKEMYPDFDFFTLKEGCVCFRVAIDDTKKTVFMVDSILKRKFNYVLSTNQREELINQNFSVVFPKFTIALSIINGQQIISIFNNLIIDFSIPKQMREKYRVLGVNKLFRPYMFKNDIKIEDIPI